MDVIDFLMSTLPQRERAQISDDGGKKRKTSLAALMSTDYVHSLVARLKRLLRA